MASIMKKYRYIEKFFWGNYAYVEVNEMADQGWRLVSAHRDVDMDGSIVYWCWFEMERDE